MGKRVEKALGRDKGHSSNTNQDGSEESSKSPEPYTCTGQFHTDFQELCRRNNMVAIPPVMLRPKRPPSPSHAQPAVEEKSRPGKKDDKKNQPVPEPEPEPELDEHGEPPPKTYITKEKFDYFRPCVQVEMDNPDKQDTVTEIYVRGWKIDAPMMEVFRQSCVKLERLHTMNLWNTGITDETLETLASFLPECLNLRNLVLDNNPVKGERFDLFLKEEMPVQHLSLRYNKITDHGAQLLGKELGTAKKANLKLLSLNLNGNSITDQGAEHLATGLRMNRTLLSLNVASNKIGNKGVSRLAETLSRFALTHEEIVERRRLLSDKSSPERQKSPIGGGSSRRAESRDRPGSVRSSHGNISKAGKSAKNKKEGTKGKEDEKQKGKKDLEKTAKKDARGSKASVVMDAGKSTKKLDKTKGKGKGSALPEQEQDPLEVVNPLLDTVEPMDGGVIMMIGNRTLINLNLSNNQIGEEGVNAVYLAVAYQTSLAQLPFQPKIQGNGLLRICLNRNLVHKTSQCLEKLNSLMLTKDPFYKPPPKSPDQESTIHS